ncbi:Ankyrin repeat-containing domain [Lasallia pustulata]|uniref:Ankyrin repeat-containing domain n=1 Tax=Lasallia pustulata TaxID=136370 RepID=A0A1W5D9I6_9LECA|nr:Ankyrin repeat-containing domain [Lasallia pustulata]
MIASLLAKKTTITQGSPQVRDELYEDKGDQMFTSHEEASQLSRSLNELYQFASKTGTDFLSEDAQMMVISIDRILEAVEQASTVSQLNHTGRKRRRSSSPYEGAGVRQQKVRAIKRIRGLLNSSQSMSVNQPVSRSRSKLFKSRYTSQCDHTTLRTGEGNFVVFHKKSQLPITDAPSEDDPENAVLESFSATVDYLPNGAFPKSKISVSFEQFISFRSATSLNPVLSFCAMISDDAEIFQLIYEDDVHGVQRMIEQGRASLRDCDSVGRSLLYHAYSEERPYVCHFLVTHGLDVNAFFYDYVSYFAPLLHCIQFLESDMDPDDPQDLKRIQDSRHCQRILLNAGADPTLIPISSNSDELVLPTLYTMITQGSSDTVKMYLDLGADFINLDHCDTRGEPVLFGACWSGTRLEPEILQLLLDRGANPLVRRLATNETCLHEAVRNLSAPFGKFDEVNWKTFLKILLEAGLSITDKNFWGITPLDIARTFCFARRRIFEEVLAECGIDFDSSFTDDYEECPCDVRHAVRPYCYCDPNRRTKLCYENQPGDERNLDDNSEASGEVAEDETASAHSIRYSDLQVNHRPSEASAQLADEAESFHPGQIHHFRMEQQALWSPWPEPDAFWNDESILNGTVNATNPDPQMSESVDRDPTVEAGPWNIQTQVETPPVIHDIHAYSSTSAWASDCITITPFDTIMEYEGPTAVGDVEEVASPDYQP